MVLDLFYLTVNHHPERGEKDKGHPQICIYRFSDYKVGGLK